MKKTLICLASLALCCLAITAASAQVVDGVLDAAYGGPLVVQTVETQFGDTNGVFGGGYVGGSELDAAYAHVAGGRLYLMLTGNHESNINKLEVFINSPTVVGGENTLSGTPQYDFETSPGFWNSQNLGGMVFDAGFEADYHLFSRWGGGGTPGPYEVDFVDRQGGGSAMVPGSAGIGSVPAGARNSSGSILAGAVAPYASGSALTQSLDFAIDDSNAAGVVGGTGAADMAAAAAVTTGMEFSIALADLGNPGPGDVLEIAAMINAGDHQFLSNQVLAGLPAGTANLGSPAGVDFNQFGGPQFFRVVVPEPTSVSLLGMGMLALMATRRR